MNRLKKIKKDTGIKRVFVCLDIGKYGSSSSGLDSKPVIDNLGPVYDSFLSRAVGGGMTLAKLDSTFSNTTLRDNPGFVAMMQKTIAAKGTVLVLIGGYSNFHNSALEMYKSMHKKRKVFKLPKLCH